MKNILFLALLFISSNLYALDRVTLPLRIKNDAGDSKTLVFGVDKNASDCVDTTLGEIFAPRIFPPGDAFFAAFVICDTVFFLEPVFSYKDYRPVQNKLNFFVQHDFVVKWGNGTKLTFEWDALPSSIDSAKITDLFDDLDIISINMKDSNKAVITNSAFDEFYIKVWYKNINASIVDVKLIEKFEIFPNPVSESLIVKSNNENFRCELFSTLGELLISKNVFQNEIQFNLKNFNTGIYFLKLTSKNGQVQTKIIQKI